MSKFLIASMMVTFLSACTPQLYKREYQVMLHSQEYQVQPAQIATSIDIDQVEKVFRKYREYLISKHIPNSLNGNPNLVVFRIGSAYEILPTLQRWSRASVVLSYSEDEGFRVRVEGGYNPDEYGSYFIEQMNRSITETTSIPVRLGALSVSQ